MRFKVCKINGLGDTHQEIDFVNNESDVKKNDKLFNPSSKVLEAN